MPIIFQYIFFVIQHNQECIVLNLNTKNLTMQISVVVKPWTVPEYNHADMFPIIQIH